ncbi:MAG: hypothetical protein EPO20_14735 [Betaproteobacteria bacterium]|nr:MAG: hypothetical protein EPO20_14735 [Betaproteobacteria bacterium]
MSATPHTPEKIDDWPRDLANGRYLCSPEKPMPKGAPGQWSHTGAKWVRDNYDSTVDYYRCVDCGTYWGSEVAQ